MKKMKKALALLLCVIMAFSSFAVGVSAISYEDVRTKTKYPTITVRGNGEEMYSKDGNKVVWPPEFEKDDLKNLPQQIADVVWPYIIPALATGNFDEVALHLKEELLKIFGEACFDGNGDSLGSGLWSYSGEHLKLVYNDKDNYEYTYGLWGVRHYYDWRLDPYENADILNGYIQQMKASYGVDKVNIYARCLGGSMLMAYLERYGSNDLNAVFFDSAITAGSDKLTDFFTGNFALDGEVLKRYTADSGKIVTHAGDPDDKEDGTYDLYVVLGLLLQTVSDIVSTLTTSHAADKITDPINKLYKGVKDQLIPEVCLGTAMGTWPGYWAIVNHDKFDEAVNFVFNTPELKEEYAGLIEKAEHYQNAVLTDPNEIINKLMADGVKVGNVCKYNCEMMPIFGSANEVGDETVTIRGCSFGATSATSYNSRLSDDYVNLKIAQGKGDYISADRQIDASTSILGDKVWFERSLSHDSYDPNIPLVREFFISNGDMTVNTDPAWPRFMLAHMEDNEEATFEPLTALNMDDENEYETGEEPVKGPFAFIKSIFKTIADAFKTLFEAIKRLFVKK